MPSAAAETGSSRRPVRRLLPLLAALLLTACGGKGCASLSTTPPTPKTPDALLIDNGAAMRLTQHGFDVIAAQVIDLLGLLFGKTSSGAAKIDVGSLLGPVQISIGGGLGLFQGKAQMRDLVLAVDLDALTISLVEGSAPARLRLGFDHARLTVLSGVVAGGTKVLGVSTDAACQLQNGLDIGKPSERLATISATVDVVLGIDAKGALDLGMDVADPVIHDVGFRLGQDCGLPECTDKVLAEDPCLECGLCQTGELGSAAVAGLVDLLGPLLSDVLETVTGLLLDAIILPGLNGKPLDLELPLDLQAAVAGADSVLAGLLGPSQPLYARVRPQQGAFSVSGGALLARFDAAAFAPADPCARAPGADDTPAFAAMTFSAPPALPPSVATSAGEEKVDLGLLLAQPMLEQMAWAALRSGLLCIHADSTALRTLSAGAIHLNAAAVDLVVPGLRRLVAPDAALRVALSPSTSPPPPERMSLQSLPGGAIRLRMALRDVGVLIETEARWRWLTLIEAHADAVVSLSLQVQGGQLAIQVEGIELQEVAITTAPLVDAAGLPGLAPALVDLAVALLFAQPIALDLDVAGLLDGFGLPLQARPLAVGVLGSDDWLWLALALDNKAGTP